jgi:hypothetical protein
MTPQLPIAHRVHNYIKDHPGCTPAEITEALGLVRRSVNKAVENLAAGYKIFNVNPKVRPAQYSVDKPAPVLVQPTNKPVQVHKPLPVFDKPVNLPVRPGTVGGTYSGAELRAFDARPGAMDAFDKPSVVAGTQVERTRPALICAGVRDVGPSGGGTRRFA